MATAAAAKEETAHKFAKDQLKAFVERVERLEEEKKTISDDIKDVYSEARGKGDILSPEQYARSCDMMILKYHGEIMPQSYEKYVEDLKTPEYLVFLEFNEVGARQLADLTSSNISRKLAVVVDGYVVTAPVIREEILGGSVQLTTGGKQEDADRLVGILKG